VNLTNDQSSALIREHLLRSAAVKQSLAEQCSREISDAASLIAEALESGGKILLCGNGGSAADCQHIAAEFASVLSKDFLRPPMAAIALTTDTSFLTANANDFGFEGIFARQIEALGRRRDVLVAISTSGNSPNVIRAVSRARELGLQTIVLTGSREGQLAHMADVAIKVPSENTSHIQESHIAIGHAICAVVEQSMFGSRSQAIASGQSEGTF
jgi:phosphoheptose isomerase